MNNNIIIFFFFETAVKVLSVAASHEVQDVIFPDEGIFEGKTWLDEGDSIKLTGKAVKGAGKEAVSYF